MQAAPDGRAGRADAKTHLSRYLERVEQGETILLCSAASAWEISIQWAAGRLPIPQPPHEFVPKQRQMHWLKPLCIEEEDVLRLHRLPELHHDPFDRILVCQAISHGLAILTPDPEIGQYPVRVIW